MPSIIYWRTSHIQKSIDMYRRKPDDLKDTIRLMTDQASEMIEEYLAKLKKKTWPGWSGKSWIGTKMPSDSMSAWVLNLTKSGQLADYIKTNTTYTHDTSLQVWWRISKGC